MKKQFFKAELAMFMALVTMLFSACGTASEGDATDAGAFATPSETEIGQNNGNGDESTSVTEAGKHEVIILYTNDIHAYLNHDEDEDGGISYAELAQMKTDLGEHVLLVDAGDHVQGSVYGALDEGQSVLEIMDEIYDLATIGNHEFDYGIERMLSLTGNARYPYISCSFVHKENGEPVLAPHVLKTVGEVQVGFVGISTPETMTSTAPSYFQNEAGDYIYDFLDGEALYAAVQASVDALRAEGADYVIALGHVGVDSYSKMTSRKVISNVSGLDAFIDGHSHTEIAGEAVKDKDGKDVILTQTGYYFGNVGKMTIGDAGITTELISSYAAQDEGILIQKNEWVAVVNGMLGEKIGTLDGTLSVNDENGVRLVRMMGTAIGEFVADSYYYYVNFVTELDCDMAIINGGGVRASIEAGDVSYMSLKAVNPFGNMICAVELTGQQILDMLEWGSRATMGVAGEGEEGSFLHTAGVKYAVDTTVPSTVLQDEEGIWTGAPTDGYRVKDVMIYDKDAKAYVDLDLTKTYCVAGANYTLTDGGGGFAMIGGKVVKDYIVEDYMALAAYAIAFEDVNGDDLSDIASENSPLRIYEGYGINYEEPLGDHRINIQ